MVGRSTFTTSAQRNVCHAGFVCVAPIDMSCTTLMQLHMSALQANASAHHFWLGLGSTSYSRSRPCGLLLLLLLFLLLLLLLLILLLMLQLLRMPTLRSAHDCYR